MLKHIYLSLLPVLFLAACAPSPEERLARAENYMAEADYRSAILELKNASRTNPDYAAARLLLAEASYQVGDLRTAKSEYERALALGEDRPEVWVALGRTLVDLGEIENAFERVLPNLDDNLETEAAFLLKGDVLRILGNSTEAAIEYMAALEINAESTGALIGGATLAAAAGNHGLAQELIDRAIRTNPVSAMAWRAKGDYLAGRRAYADAADAYSQSMSVETATTPLLHRFETRVNRTTALVSGRRIDAARQQLSDLTQKYPQHPILRYLAGRIAFAAGENELAQQALQEYLAQVPRDARGQALLGAVHFSRDNLRQAEMYLLQAVRANSGGAATRRLLAETLLRLNRPEEALAELKLSEIPGTQDPMLLSMLGRAEIGRGDTEEAIRYFERGLAADPKNPAMSLALAVTYLQGRRVGDAIGILEAMPHAPGSIYRRETLLIGAYLQDGQRDRAIEQGDEFLRSSPGDAQALELVGILHKTIGNTERSKHLFMQALDIDPEILGALFNLGTIALEHKDFASSQEFFIRLLDAHPAHVASLISLAAVLREQGRPEELRPRLDAAIDAAPKSIEPRVLSARLEISLGRLRDALAQVSEAQAVFPDEPGLDHLKGRILLQQNLASSAIESLRRAVMAAPKHAAYVFDLAAAQLKNSDFRAAAASARQYRELRPEDVRGLSLLVDAEIHAGNPQKVEAEVMAFLADNPDLSAAHLIAGDVQLSIGLPTKALPHYERAANIEWSRGAALQIARARSAVGAANSAEPLERWLAENPKDSEVRNFYAQLLESGGDIDLAIQEYEHLHSLGQLTATGLNNLAWQYAQSGRTEAVDLAQHAHDLDPENGSITDTLGWILFNKGEMERAVRLLRAATRQSPDDLEIQFHLASVLIGAGLKSEASRILDAALNNSESFPSRSKALKLAEKL